MASLTTSTTKVSTAPAYLEKASTPIPMTEKCEDKDLIPQKVFAGGDSAVFNGKAATITRADEKLTDVVNVSVDPERRKNGQVNGGEIREEISVRQGLNDVQVLTDNIKLILSDGSLASEWSGMFAGDGCAYKRVSIRQGSSFHYGVAAARISCDFDNANNSACKLRKSSSSKLSTSFRTVSIVDVYLDLGTTLKVNRKQVQQVPALNKRRWTIVSPLLHAYTPGGGCNPEGSYPVYLSTRCMGEEYGKLLEKELRTLENSVVFDHYHDSEGKGNWKPHQRPHLENNSEDKHQDKEDATHREQTLVRVLYGYDCEEDILPCQNPCGGVQWSSDRFEPPYIPMPPATRHLSKLLRYGSAALTLYRHRNCVGCLLKLILSRSGSRVGSKEKKNALFRWRRTQFGGPMLRVLVPRSSYSWYYPSGAWCISARLHQVKRRYFPVLTAKDVKDVEAARKIPKAVVTSSLSDESTQT
eukprot:jgi/Bigna1/84788/estExt_fgenesh1_pg.C_10061